MFSLTSAIFVVLGLAAGSFLNAWIWRTRTGKSMVKGRSVCPACDHVLSWKDLIPVLSYLGLVGKCRYCRKHISWQYPLVELFMAVGFLASWLVHQEFALAVRDAFILFMLLFVFVYDLRYQEIWDKMTTVPAVLLFAANLFFGWLSLADMFLGMLAGGGFFLAQYLLSKGRWIGAGDIRMGVFMGVILGLNKTLLALFLAYIAGAVIGVLLLASKKKAMGSRLPFGTFLAASTAVSLFWGQQVVQWYLQFI